MSESRAAYFRDYRAKRAVSLSKGGLLPFQQAFVDAVCRVNRPPEIAILSTPRAAGKSWLCGGLVARSLTPGDPLFEPGVENILVSSSTAQARITLEFARSALGESDAYRWRNDGVVHLASRARVRIVSSDSRRALGLGAVCRLIVADEPGAWSPVQGRRLWDAMLTSLGKRRTQIIVVGTLAPAPLTGPASWWPSLVAEGSGDGRHVALLQADPEKWKDFDEVLRCNPVSAINPFLTRTLEREHKAALASERAARPFKQFRLNLPGDPVESQPLITSAEWARVCARPVPAREGKPIIGIDLGGSRSWCAGCGIWPTGRIEAWALAPGVPSLADQERDDQVPEGTYGELALAGGLGVAEGQHVPDIGLLLARIWDWEPVALVCDSYRVAELHKAVQGRVRVVERGRGHGESTSNIQSLRSLLLDGPAGIVPESRALLAAAFAQTSLVIGNDGLTKVTKLDQRRSRDDASAALLLAAGERARRPATRPARVAFITREGEVRWL